MRVAITGGTGFVGRHLARELVARGQQVVLIARGKDVRDESIYKLSKTSFCKSDMSDAQELRRTFLGCDAVAHCGGINREIGAQTYARVHVAGTEHVVEAARLAGVRKMVLLSFLRARPNCGSAYHESKWAADEIVRGSGLNYTIFKAGVIYGRGDHMLDHLSHALYTFPIFGLVGMKERQIRPVAVEDLVTVIIASFGDARLANKTLGITGPEEFGAQRGCQRGGRGHRETSALSANAACDAKSCRLGRGANHEDPFAVARATANFVGRHRGGSSRLRCASCGFATSDVLHRGANRKWIAGARTIRFARSALLQGVRRTEERSTADVGLAAIWSIGLAGSANRRARRQAAVRTRSQFRF